MSGDEPTSTPPSLRDIRPLVGRPVSNRGIWIFAAMAALGGSFLFAALERHRASIVAPAIAAAPDELGEAIGGLPPLAIPAAYGPQPAPPQIPQEAAVTPPRGGEWATYAPPRPVVVAPQAAIDPDTLAAIRMLAARQSGVQAPLPAAFVAGRGNDVSGRGQRADGGRQDERVEAGRFANPSTTVPKGTVIQAVLETALDSTRAGLARAIISRDVYSFDGTKVLIPKGSRLIGEYKADLAGGQNRALIEWQRLMRPDAVVMNINSPSADPLGRAGVKGAVNSHFFERFGGAILQSALNIGTQVGVSKISSGSVVYAIPLTTQAVPVISQEKIAPTLTVREGTSVSVFVARDLDFTSVEP